MPENAWEWLRKTVFFRGLRDDGTLGLRDIAGDARIFFVVPRTRGLVVPRSRGPAVPWSRVLAVSLSRSLVVPQSRSPVVLLARPYQPFSVGSFIVCNLSQRHAIPI